MGPKLRVLIIRYISILVFLLIHLNLLSQKPELIIPAAETSPITCAAFSSDDRYILTGNNNGQIKLWEVETGKAIRIFEFAAAAIKSKKWQDATEDFKITPVAEVRFFHDNQKIIGSLPFGVFFTWDIESGEFLTEYYAKNALWRFPKLSHSGNYIVIPEKNKIKIIDIETFEVHRTIKCISKQGYLIDFIISHDDSFLLAYESPELVIWDVVSGAHLKSYSLPDHYSGLSISPDNKYFTSSGRNKTNLHSFETGEIIETFDEGASNIQFLGSENRYLVFNEDTWYKFIDRLNPDQSPFSSNLNFKPDLEEFIYSRRSNNYLPVSNHSNSLIRSTAENYFCLFNQVTRSFEKHFGKFNPGSSVIKQMEIGITNNGQFLYNYSYGGEFDYNFSYDEDNLLLWNLFDNQIYNCYDHFNPDQGDLVIPNQNQTLSIKDDRFYSEFSHSEYQDFHFSEFQSDSNNIKISITEDGQISISSIDGTEPVKILKGHSGGIYGFRISNTLKYLVTLDEKGMTRLWNLKTGDQVSVIEVNQGTNYIEFSRDDNYFIIQDYDELKVYNTSNGDIAYSVYSIPIIWNPGMDPTQGPVIWDITIIDSTNIAIARNTIDNTLYMYDLRNQTELARLNIIDSVDWVVIKPNGLFDASPGAMREMYYVQGMEIIEFDQLKERYYEPGLLQKLLGINPETIRDVTGLQSLDLYPEITVTEPDKNTGQLDVHLTNRGGGIGEVKIYINGKEIASDARGDQINPDIQNLTITQDIGNHPYLISGKNNTIEVKAYNAEGYLSSRGVQVKYNPGKTADKTIPKLFILSSGVSDYTGEAIDLKYAAKDAEDMLAAIEVGAKRLFGTEKTYTYLLTTNQDEDEQQPSKVNITRALKDISKKANSSDIIVVYLSGHGINYGGENGDFYYLTKEAYTASADAYGDPAIRSKCTLSSDEMVELIKQVPALKQVLIIDACASGRVVENLMAQRNVSSSTLRALDRMKDRTGMHIITGCTADAVSYEASRYGQGVLTYSLLEGIKGAALRDNRYIDINMLFQSARERVPQLAEGLGGIQKPEIFSPYGAESFDIGELNNEDKNNIPLSRIKPVFVRSNFQDEEELADILNLSQAIDDILNEGNPAALDKSIIFVDARDFPDAHKVSGLYYRENGFITLNMRIKTPEITQRISVTGTNKEEIINQVLEKINAILSEGLPAG